MRRLRDAVGVAALLGMSAGCARDATGRDARRPATDAARGSARPGTGSGARAMPFPAAWSVDSSLDAFRAGLPVVDSLRHGASSPGALVEAFADALERADTAALVRLHLSRAEFAWLVYPGSRWTRAPYRQPPELTWMLISERTNVGLARLLQRRGGQPLHLMDYSCDAAPEVEGRVRYRGGCTVRHRTATGAVVRERLFSSIVEHAGRFKIGSYGNQY